VLKITGDIVRHNLQNTGYYNRDITPFWAARCLPASRAEKEQASRNIPMEFTKQYQDNCNIHNQVIYATSSPSSWRFSRVLLQNQYRIDVRNQIVNMASVWYFANWPEHLDKI